MKTPSLLLTLLSVSSAFAAPALVTTNFWQAPYQNEFQVSFVAAASDLMNTCKHMETMTYSSDGTPRIDSGERMERLRQEPMLTQTSDAFLLSVPVWSQSTLNLDSGADAAAFQNAVDGNRVKDKLPLFSQNSVGVFVQSNSLSNFLIETSEKSFVSLSRKLGLKDSRIQLKQNAQGLSLEIEGADVACDLVFGRAKLFAKAKANVRIGTEEHKQIMNLYASIDQIALKVLKEKQSPAQRAAILGFRLGGYLASQAATAAKSETLMMEILNHVFDLEKMEPNSKWTSSLGEKHLVVNNQSDEVPVSIQISLKVQGE